MSPKTLSDEFLALLRESTPESQIDQKKVDFWRDYVSEMACPWEKIDQGTVCGKIINASTIIREVDAGGKTYFLLDCISWLRFRLNGLSYVVTNDWTYRPQNKKRVFPIYDGFKVFFYPENATIEIAFAALFPISGMSIDLAMLLPGETITFIQRTSVTKGLKLRILLRKGQTAFCRPHLTPA